MHQTAKKGIGREERDPFHIKKYYGDSFLLPKVVSEGREEEKSVTLFPHPPSHLERRRHTRTEVFNQWVAHDPKVGLHKAFPSGSL